MDYRSCCLDLDRQDIKKYLDTVDKEFAIPLSTKCNSTEYADKLLSSGHVICAYEESIAGLIGFYANDFNDHKAYITILSVRYDYRRKGIGKALVKCAIEESKRCGMQTIFVDSVDSVAIHTYQTQGFEEYRCETIMGITKHYFKKVL